MQEPKTPQLTTTLNVDAAVRNRYGKAAQAAEAALCCPVDYDPGLLKMIPQEIIDRDYGCGDPSQFVETGDTVLDLGSGGGKICYIAAQIVGESGRVIGVDCNDDMLSLARKYEDEIADKLGYHNVEFRKGKIQDLKLNLELLDQHLIESPVNNSSDWLRIEEHAQHLRQSEPLIQDDSVDVIVSNCVLNLVRQQDRQQLFGEVYRVLKPGGRAVISDIVCDEDVPQSLQQDAELWSGCLSGAFREDLFLEAFASAGFYGMEIVARQTEPWAVVQGIEFRSMTVRAFKGNNGPRLDRKQAVIYNGPWQSVIDDDGNKLVRGQRSAVCDKTFQQYTHGPYRDQLIPVEPNNPVPIEAAESFNCDAAPIRLAKQTKGPAESLTILPTGCCGPNDCC